MNKVQQIYKELLEKYNYQGWWPIDGKYHPEDYSYPKTGKQQFEICIGTILTQNTAWTNVEKALYNLRKLKALEPKKILKTDENKLKNAIKPSGYFNQKAHKCKQARQIRKERSCND